MTGGLEDSETDCGCLYDVSDVVSVLEGRALHHSYRERLDVDAIAEGEIFGEEPRGSGQAVESFEDDPDVVFRVLAALLVRVVMVRFAVLTGIAAADGVEVSQQEPSCADVRLLLELDPHVLH